MGCFVLPIFNRAVRASNILIVAKSHCPFILTRLKMSQTKHSHRLFSLGIVSMCHRALDRDPSTRHLDGLFHLWTGFYKDLHVFLNIWATKVAQYSTIGLKNSFLGYK